MPFSWVASLCTRLNAQHHGPLDPVLDRKGRDSTPDCCSAVNSVSVRAAFWLFVPLYLRVSVYLSVCAASRLSHAVYLCLHLISSWYHAISCITPDEHTNHTL